MVKRTLSILTAVLVSFLNVPIAHAAEINPNPSTYSFGSTSEFSPFLTLGQSTPTPGTLTPTGQNQMVFVGLAIGLILVSIIMLVFVLSQKRKNKLYS